MRLNRERETHCTRVCAAGTRAFGHLWPRPLRPRERCPVLKIEGVGGVGGVAGEGVRRAERLNLLKANPGPGAGEEPCLRSSSKRRPCASASRPASVPPRGSRSGSSRTVERPRRRETTRRPFARSRTATARCCSTRRPGIASTAPFARSRRSSLGPIPPRGKLAPASLRRRPQIADRGSAPRRPRSRSRVGRGQGGPRAGRGLSAGRGRPGHPKAPGR